MPLAIAEAREISTSPAIPAKLIQQLKGKHTPPSETKEEVDLDTTGAIENDANVASLKFADDIKILLIPSTSMRIICHFLGYDSIQDIKNAPFNSIPMIGLMLQECAMRYMTSKGYAFAGQINFDREGNPVPVGQHVWTIKQKEVCFVNNGYLFFDAQTGNHKDNVVMYMHTDINNVSCGIHVFASSMERAKQTILDLDKYTKRNNCLRGAKMRDVNMASASFSEVIVGDKFTWDNYYFPKQIRDIFSLEVFGFLKNAARYNAMGIQKRGIMVYGVPGTGKTTIGHIVCNYAPDSTVIWITPELIAENNTGRISIKLLYTLADYVSPCVIILEDLDLFAEDREGAVDQLRLGALMNILDGVNSVHNAVTVATTNRLNLIEKALSNRPGRFDRVIEIPPLSDDLRLKMFTDRLSGCICEPGVIEYLVKNTPKWTGAESQEFINSLNLYFINKNKEQDRKVNQEVIDHVLDVMTKYCIKPDNRKIKVGFGAE